MFRKKRPSLDVAPELALLNSLGIVPATVVDVGASDGRWSRGALEAFPSANYILFEPHHVFESALDALVNEHPQMRTVASAVGGADGVAQFTANGDPFGGRLQSGDDSVTVPLVTLDTALADAAEPFLVKLDTHGAEADILAGASRTLAHSNALLIEAYNNRFAPECLLFWELCATLETKGFRPVHISGLMDRPHDDSLWQMDICFIRSDWAGFAYPYFG